MRESTFIDRNKKRWEDTEAGYKTEPDEVASDFIDLVNDLSYAQTHYPHSKITEYINFLASRVYKSIYLNQKVNKNPILDFWKKDFPLIIGHNKSVLWVSVAFFLSFSILGYVCSFLDPEFVQSILGQNYIEMTENNIKNGTPFGVYRSDSPLYMFCQIFSNNFFVGLIVYMSGILLGVGTFYYTFSNGIMFGAFMSMFFKHHLGTDAIFVIMLHGTFELMGLILECMAGLILGLSFLFPHTLTRKQAFLKGLNESAKIFIGTIPFTLMAAIIESFVTYLGQGGFNKTNIFIIIALTLLLIACWVVVVRYFFTYSKKLANKYPYEEYLRMAVKD